MSVNKSLCVFAFVLCLYPGLSMALEGTETVSTYMEHLPEPLEGNQYQKGIVSAWKLIREEQYSKAFAIADELISEIEKTFKEELKQYAFKSEAEYAEFVARNDGAVQRIDWSYTEALRIKAYIYSSNRYFEMALAELDKIDVVAPVSAGAKIEKGYVLGQLDELSRAHETYQDALELAGRYSSQSVYKAAALRGIGFILIEMQRLDEAEEALQKSLAIEPGNDTALNELAYIKELRGS